MEKSLMCRLCMAEDVRLLNIVNTHLQEMYESLLLIPLENEDGKPLTACFICCTRLQNCYQLRKRGLRSDELFPQLMNTTIVHANRMTSEVNNNLGITGVLQLNLGDVPRQSTEPHAELNTLAVLEEFGVHIGEEKDENPFYKRSIELLEDVEALEYIISIVQRELTDAEINSICLGSDSDTQLSEIVPYVGPHNALPGVDIHELQDTNNNLSSDQDVEVLSPPMVIDDAGDTNLEKQEQTNNQITEPVNETYTNDVPLKKATKRFIIDDLIGYRRERKIYGPSLNLYKYLTCNICFEGFIRKVDLLKHTLIEHPRVKNYAGNTEFIDTPNTLTDHNDITTDLYLKSDKCKCNECFNNFFLFQYPYMPVVEEPHKCDKCDKSNVNNHDSVHEKPHKCTECKKSFDLDSELHSHFREHTGEKPHVCNVCNQIFRMKRMLDEHLVEHSGKEFLCDQCGQNFENKSSLVTHMEMQPLGYEKFQCNICDQCFNCKLNFDAHMCWQ